METNEKTDKTRIKEKRLVLVPVIMRSQLIRGDFTRKSSHTSALPEKQKQSPAEPGGMDHT